jgi:membrane associated rhomboid family serine protease
MGIYDREYYRRESPYLSTWLATGRVCKWLVLANIAVYILQLVTTPVEPSPEGSVGFVTDWLAMRPARAFYHFEIWRVLTGAFLHDPWNWTHIFWNMVFLWWFGRDMEDLYGSGEFLLFYLISGIAGNLLWGVTALAQGYSPQAYALGASGAVTAVMVLCACHYPTRTILVMFILPVPLWLWALLHVCGDLFYFLRGVNIGVAVAAHVGGAAFGFLYYKFAFRLLPLWRSVASRVRRPVRPRLRIYREEAPAARGPAVAETTPPARDRQLEAAADAVLEKVSRLGIQSLTPEEKDILQRASERYRRRRNPDS